MKHWQALLFGAMMGLASLARADLETDIADAIAADEAAGKAAFNIIAKDLNRGMVHREVSVPATLGGGIGGISVSVDASSVPFDKRASDLLTGGNGDLDVSTLVVPRVSVSAGLPAVPVNLSASYMNLGEDIFTVFSGQIGYALWSGGVLEPALNVYYSYSRSTALKVIDTTIHALGARISKGFGAGIKVVPFAGAAYVSAESELNASNGTNTYRFSRSDSGMQLMWGASFQIGLFELAYQGDSLFDDTTHTLRLGLRF